jgi:CheY-like chemotaxis protein
MREKALTEAARKRKQPQIPMRPASLGETAANSCISPLDSVPWSASPAPPEAGPERGASAMLTSANERAKTTILVVDDSPEMLRYLRTLLEVECFRVVTAHNGQEALTQLQAGCAPVAVILDLQMPVMDGLQTLQRLRQLRPELKVIMCSAVEDPAQIRHALSLGAEVFLHKPVQHLYLSAALQRCMQEPPTALPEVLLPKPRRIPAPRLRALKIREQGSAPPL